MRQGRGSLYLLTGLVLGIALGLVVVWLLRPSPKANIKPVSLSLEEKDRYRAMIAFAFLANEDLVRARARLVTLGDPDVNLYLLDQAQRLAAQGSSPQEAQALLLLLEALNREE